MFRNSVFYSTPYGTKLSKPLSVGVTLDSVLLVLSTLVLCNTQYHKRTIGSLVIRQYATAQYSILKAESRSLEFPSTAVAVPTHSPSAWRGGRPLTNHTLAGHRPRGHSHSHSLTHSLTLTHSLSLTHSLTHSARDSGIPFSIFNFQFSILLRAFVVCCSVL